MQHLVVGRVVEADVSRAVVVPAAGLGGVDLVRDRLEHGHRHGAADSRLWLSGVDQLGVESACVDRHVVSSRSSSSRSVARLLTQVDGVNPMIVTMTSWT